MMNALDLLKQTTIPWQLKFLFPASISENQELLETLKREYSQTWLSEEEKKLLQQAIQDEKDRPVFIQK